MKERNKRWKAALIPVLVLILAYLLWDRFAAPSGAIPADARTELASKTSRQNAKLQRKKELARPSQFSTHNPFVPFGTKTEVPRQIELPPGEELPDDKPLPLNESADGDLPPFPPELGEVQAIFRDGSGVSALVGNVVLRVGDIVANDFRVEAITDEGVQLQRVRE